MRGKSAGLIVALLLVCAVCLGQTHTLERSVFGSAGGRLSGTGNALAGTAGQAVQGNGTSSSHKGDWGFWYRLDDGGAPPGWLPGWHEVASPSGIKPVKDGGWLAVGPDKGTGLGVRGSGIGNRETGLGIRGSGIGNRESGIGSRESGSAHLTTWSPDHLVTSVVYAGLGNKTTTFAKYDPMDGEDGKWTALGALPDQFEGKTKPPSKGSRGIAADGAIYYLHGNNTLGFWKYDIQTETWEALDNVPLGSYKKKVKGGEDMVYVHDGTVGWIYLLKGQRTEFYRFNTATRQWDETLNEVPFGGGKQKYDRGSFLVYDGTSTIYAHQAKVNDGTNHYMYAFDLNALAWDQTAKKGIPVYADEGGKTKKKKAGDGSAGAWQGGTIYAQKGGNTQSFFKYSVSGNDWTELDNIPDFGTSLKKKRIKAGGDLVAYEGAFFVFKGNKTYELWRYAEGTPLASRPTPHAREGIQAGVIGNGEWRMGIEPNPISSGSATLRYSLPRPGTASVTVFDIAGRSVFSTRSPCHLTTGSLPLDLRSLSGGVYLVKLEADSFTQTQKLVVQK